MEKGNIVFFKDNFYVINLIDGNSIALLKDDILITIDKSELNENDFIEIPSYYIDDIYNEKNLKTYTTTIISRGKTYYRNGRVGKFFVYKGVLFAEVYGSDIYEVEISFNSFDSCSCPMGMFCKHSVAVILTLKDIFSNLQENYLKFNRENFIDNSNIIDNSLITGETLIDNNYFDVDKFFKYNISDFIGPFLAKKAKVYDKELSSLSIDEKKLFLDELETRLKNIYDSGAKSYLYHFVFDKSLHDFVQIIYANSKYALIQQQIGNAIHTKSILNNRLPHYEEEKANYLFYLYINNKYIDLLEYYSKEILGKVKYTFYLEETLKYLDFETINEVFPLLNFRKEAKPQDFKVFINYLNEENHEILMKAKPQLILEDSKYASNLTSDVAYDMINDFTDEEILDFIVKYKELFIAEPQKLKNVILNIYMNLNIGQREELVDIARLMPNSKYFVEYVSKYSYYDYKEHNLIYEEDLEAIDFNKLSKEINAEELFTYFNLEYRVCEDRVTETPQIQVRICCNEREVAICSFVDKELRASCVSQLSKYPICEFIYLFILENNKEDIDAEYNEVIEEIKQRHYEENLRAMENSLAQFSQDVYSSIGATGETKVTFVVELEDKYEGLKLKLRIGKIDAKQFYKVKSLEKLVTAFYKKETIVYGKNLTFKHDVTNVYAPYDTLVKYLMQIYHFSVYTVEGINLNQTNWAKIFEILENMHILYNEKETSINPNLLEVKYSVDDKLVVHTSTKNSSKVFDFIDAKYAYFEEKNEFQKLDISVKDEPLFKFFRQFEGSSIEPIKEKFRDIIYSMYPQKIEIDENKKEDFKINDILIDAYFDYQNGLVSVNSKYSKDDVEIKESDLIQSCDISKVNTYKNYLSTLGFTDSKICDETNILNFFELDFSYLKSLANVYLSDSISNKYVKSLDKQVVIIEKNKSIFEAFLEPSVYSSEELTKILKAIKKKKKFILLREDQIIKLDDNASEFYQTLEDLNIDIDKPLESVNIPIYQALKAYAHEKNCQIDDYLSDMVNEIKNYKDFEVSIPNVNAELRNYQIEGFKWLSILKKYHIGGILADDMGLGKTLQIITLISSDTSEKPSLIVCPKSLVFNWINEFEKFAPEVSVTEIYGNALERKNVEENIDNDKRHVYIISYDSLGRDINTLSKLEYAFVILDEAQTIKNVYAKKSENVKLLKAEYRYALTGTPIENTVIDLWSLFDFLMPQYFEELSVFKSRYLHDEKYTQIIAKKVAPFILRRTKKDVLKDLPAKYERIITCEMNEEQQKYYDAHVLEAKNLMKAGSTTFDIFPYLMRLRQICIDPGLFISDTKETGAKLVELYSIINDYKNEHKMLIFSQFVSALNKVETYLKENDIPYYMITGDTDAKVRLEICNKFNNDKTPIFLVSLKAGGTGLNLIGADTVIHIDPWWNSSAENQATDRAHRIGQTKNVEVIKLITANSIEQRVIELQNYKKDIIDKLIASNDNRLTHVTLEDLAFILKK